jgi:hypothetical protein
LACSACNYIWQHILAEPEGAAEPLAAEPAAPLARGRGRLAGRRGRGAGRGAGRGRGVAAEIVLDADAEDAAGDGDGDGEDAAEPEGFNPNDPEMGPQHNWSLTLTRSGQNVPIVWLTLLHGWYEHYDIKGVASLEKGSSRQQLHVQSIFECHCGEGEKPLLVASIKGHLMLGGDNNSKLTIKPFEPSQRWEAMVGYVQKDWGESHFQLRAHRVSQDELAEGRVRYRELKDDFMSGRVPLNRKTFLERVYAYRRANYHPFWVPATVVVLHMLLSQEYVPGTSWVNAKGGGIDQQKHEVWEFVVNRPQSTTLRMVEVLFYDEPVFRPRGQGVRYYAEPFAMSDELSELNTWWRREAHRPHEVFAAMNVLRSMLQLQQAPMTSGQEMDDVFIRCIPEIMIRLSAEQLEGVRTMFAPAHAAAEDGEEDSAMEGEAADDGDDSFVGNDGIPAFEDMEGVDFVPVA